MSIAALLVASMGGDFKGPAALLPWNRTPLVDHVLGEVASWPVDEVMVVIGMDEERVLSKASLSGATVLVDPGWNEGTASSLRVGLDMLTRTESADAVVVTDVLTPTIGGDVVQRMVEQYQQTERHAVVPKYRYARGKPALVGSFLWGRLMGLEGAAAIDQVLSTHPEWVDEVWVDRLPPASIRTLEDLHDVRRQ